MLKKFFGYLNSPFELEKLYTLIPGIYVEGIIKFFIFPLTNDFPGFTLIVGFVNLSNKFRLSYLIKLLSLYIIQLKNTVWHLLKISL